MIDPELLFWAAFVGVFLAAVPLVIWSDPRTRVPASALSKHTALSDEITQREEVLKASHQVTARSMSELHECAARFRASVAKGQGR